jgi:hypothetical protein
MGLATPHIGSVGAHVKKKFGRILNALALSGCEFNTVRRRSATVGGERFGDPLPDRHGPVDNCSVNGADGDGSL